MIIDKIALNPREAAEISGLGEKLIRQLCHRDDFPAFKVGRCIHIPAREFQDWLGKQAKERTGFAPNLKTFRKKQKVG